MKNLIQQSVVLPASAAALFEMYLDPTKHAVITGAPVTIGKAAGAQFVAFGGQLTGSILAVVPSKLVVQAWRSVMFKADDPDSTLILSFSDEPDGAAGIPNGRIDLVHLGVPDHDFQGVTEGWEKYYWTPWRKYLEMQ